MDKKKIVEILKKEGLPVAEESAVQAVKAIFKLLKILLPKISSGYGMIAEPFCNYCEKRLLEVIDEIDGLDNPNY
jgi:hypothetical protein